MLLGQPQRLVILAALILVLKYCSNGNSAAASAFTQKLDDEKTKRKSDNTDPKAGPVPLSSSSFGLGSELGLEPGKDIDQDVLNQAIQRAGQGNTEAQYFLGLLRYYGAGLARDPAQALDLFRRAGGRNHPDAQAAVGVLLLRGEGAPQDSTSARAWFARAADNGNIDAQWLLGMTYYEGDQDNPPDFSLAFKWFSSAAEEDHPLAMHYLGILCEYGLGTPQSFPKAAKWYARAAGGAPGRAGVAEARYHLALMHAWGRGFRQDFARALALLREGAAAGHAASALWLGKLVLAGQGLGAPDYDRAVVWFDQAARLAAAAAAGGENNKNIENEATQARDEILNLIAMAKESNQKVQKHYGMTLSEEELVGGVTIIPEEYDSTSPNYYQNERRQLT